MAIFSLGNYLDGGANTSVVYNPATRKVQRIIVRNATGKRIRVTQPNRRSLDINSRSNSEKVVPQTGASSMTLLEVPIASDDPTLILAMPFRIETIIEDR